ncbi:MAG TPA: cytochrome c nitrite reductase small subunit [Candidatus Eisenbacteria bacterium]|jgi:cytochrome c nitrite reductase small subunit|nr:cytochrome c nitrite reductase small subunit [Candidatus Eisenbacteria bacterium]
MLRARHLMVLSAVLFGVAAGVGGFTFIYAKGASYLGHDPAACANCHVMKEQFDGWAKSSHRSVAACNDCHAPHSLIPKLAVKAENGFRHSLMFTTGRFHEPIRITPRNRAVTEETCRHCHEEIVDAMVAFDDDAHRPEDAVSCIRCHGAVGHPEFTAEGTQPGR